MSETPIAPPLPKPTPWKVIIPVAIAVILCCICLVIVGVLAYMGTQGTGPLSMLATATLTPTPTKTLTPTLSVSVEGDWELYYSWDCSSYSGPAEANFYSDYTYMLSEGGETTGYGTWYLAGDYIDFIFDDSPNAHYVGTLDYTGTYMEGTMDTTDGASGCWYANKP